MKKIFLSLMCILLLIINLTAAFTVLAEEKCTVTVAKVSGNIGENVYVPISISNNPGISGVTIDFTYDSSALSYVKFKRGSAFTDSIMLKDHPTRNMIKIALAEAYDDSHNNDVILTLEFKIKDNTNADFYPISVEYDKGDFCNRKLQSIMPVIVPGGVEVKYSPESKNCGHKTYGEWEIGVKPTCTDTGVEQRFCSLCGHRDIRDTDPAGHDFEDVWTIDKVATATEDGVMTRHCKYCKYTVDRITFPYTDPDKEDFENDLGTEIPKNDYTNNLFEEQHPGEVLTGTKTEITVNSSTTVSSGTKSESKSDNTKTETNSLVNSSTDSSSEINSENVSTVTDNTETESESFLSNNENTKLGDNKLLIIISGSIILLILFSVIAIVACQKTK